jgi:tungstate transport system permease protein
LRIAAPPAGAVPKEYETCTFLIREVSRTRYAASFIARKTRSSREPGLVSMLAVDSIGGSFAQAWQLLVQLDPGLLEIVSRSLFVSACACAVGSGLGLALGAWLAVAHFRGRAVLLTFLNTSLALPSVVVGLVVYLLLSRSGPLGFLGWLFSLKAMVVAQSILVMPVAAALTRQLVEDVEIASGEQLRSLGAGGALRGLLIAWDERYALLTVVIAVFGRAIAEVGAVMIVGGNMDGFTRVMTTAIALETSKGDLPLALALGIVLLTVVLLLNALIGVVRRWRLGRTDTPVVDAVTA